VVPSAKRFGYKKTALDESYQFCFVAPPSNSIWSVYRKSVVGILLLAVAYKYIKAVFASRSMLLNDFPSLHSVNSHTVFRIQVLLVL
jgi:hypothetical protein